jgi:hypothetical protein
MKRGRGDCVGVFLMIAGFAIITAIVSASNASAITINVDSPINQTYSTKQIQINFSVLDVLGIDSIWFYNESLNLSYPVAQNVASQVVSEGNTASLNCNPGESIIAYTSFYGNDTCGAVCGTCSIGSENCSVTFDNGNCIPDPCPGSVKQGYLNISCTKQSESVYLLNNFSDGNHKLLFYANNSLGILGENSVEFNIDTILPAITIIYPTNSLYNKNVTEINYSVFDANIDSCWWNDNDGANATIACGTNWSVIPALSDGSHMINFYANDSFGNVNSASVGFSVDTKRPTITIRSPLVESNFTIYPIINFTIIDTNLQDCWWTIDKGANNNTINCTDQIIAYAWPEGKVNFTLSARDSYGNLRTVTRRFNIDTILPAITIIYPTNSLYNKNVTEINYSVFDANIDSCWWNDNDGANATIACGTNWSVIPALSDGSHMINFYANDSFGNVNSASVGFSVDTKKPIVTIRAPAANGRFTYHPEVNYTASDLNLQACWWTKDNGATNTTITCGENITGVTWNQGANTVRVYANDSYGNIGVATRNFNVDTMNPQITIIYPQNVSYNSYTLSPTTLNYTLIEANAPICWWTKDNGITNSTPSICGTSFSGLTSIEGSNTWIIYVNDSYGNMNSTSVTFFVDTTLPIVYNENYNPLCAFYYEDITVNATISDAYLKNMGISGNWEGTWKNYTPSCTLINTTIEECSYIIRASSLQSGITSFNWTYYAEDLAGNIAQGVINDYVFNKMTLLNVSPSVPDGINNWYVTEPTFTLINDNATQVFYKWNNNIGYILYTGAFKLESAPNQANITGGIQRLEWWSNTTCGQEPEQNKTFYFDFRNPKITNLYPTNNSIVYNNASLQIQAELDDIYGTNSGIDTFSVVMRVDGIIVPAIVSNINLIDAIVKYNTGVLALGMHNVTVDVKDNSGRQSSLTWFFENRPIPLINLSVSSPESSVYMTKSVPISIDSNVILIKIEYIDNSAPTPAWKTLCTNCLGYGTETTRTIYLMDGVHNITIRTYDRYGQVSEKNMMIVVDSVAPKILSTKPRRIKITNGSDFFVKYKEKNLESLELIYGNYNNFKKRPVQPSECINTTIMGVNCSFYTAFSEYDGQSITYWYNISDIARSVMSRPVEIRVDTTAPEMGIKSPNNNGLYEERTRVFFNITLSEKVKKLEYYDAFGDARWKSLCSGCSKFTSTRYFNTGQHGLTIKATDYAGNSDNEEVSFLVE